VATIQGGATIEGVATIQGGLLLKGVASKHSILFYTITVSPTLGYLSQCVDVIPTIIM